ncbi:MAG: hypothetical protein OHK0036_11380 [Bacteroidia bacterium]
MEKIKHILSGILVAISAAVADIVISNKEVFSAIFILITFDTITGIAAAIKNNRKITSWRMFIGIFLKMFFLVCILIVGAFVQKVAAYDFIGWAAIVLCSIEIFSIDENIKTLFNYSIFDTIKNIYNKNKDFIDEIKNK